MMTTTRTSTVSDHGRCGPAAVVLDNVQGAELSLEHPDWMTERLPDEAARTTNPNERNQRGHENTSTANENVVESTDWCHAVDETALQRTTESNEILEWFDDDSSHHHHDRQALLLVVEGPSGGTLLRGYDTVSARRLSDVWKPETKVDSLFSLCFL
jgi:hypothetical protein